MDMHYHLTTNSVQDPIYSDPYYHSPQMLPPISSFRSLSPFEIDYSTATWDDCSPLLDETFHYPLEWSHELPYSSLLESCSPPSSPDTSTESSGSEAEARQFLLDFVDEQPENRLRKLETELTEMRRSAEHLHQLEKSSSEHLRRELLPTMSEEVDRKPILLHSRTLAAPPQPPMVMTSGVIRKRRRVAGGRRHRIADFLLELLERPNDSNCIVWLERRKHVFQVKASREVAKQWGLRKGKNDMTWEKLSRGIRFQTPLAREVNEGKLSDDQLTDYDFQRISNSQDYPKKLVFKFHAGTVKRFHENQNAKRRPEYRPFFH